ncbi:acyclic terpene utilization AtuA family protein [Streptomyces sp. CA-181903]|uniref:acyclic terpene utilization AtuA family protein n=1 Tax=Streptomyces sp. CA-181903 TaxID=3240055 RepID=UPI003D91DC0A
MEEMLTGGPLDVLTGDYLAELTMLVLGRDRLKDPERGYARTFLRQLETCLGMAAERGVRIVANAGGLNPAGLAGHVRELAERLGTGTRVAYVTGDDLLPTRDWGPGVLTANAYLGGAGIAACLRAGADVVVTGRVTDAALVSGVAAAHYGWRPGAYDALAGAVVAGHVLECGAQATGGNYAFFREHDIRRPGFPIAEVHPDGSSLITKHSGTGGAVTVGTVTAQLLYETQGARYPGPDVTARLDTVRLTQDGPDRVRIDGVRGEPPPASLKAGLTRLGGLRNEVVFVLTGLDIEAKARLVRAQMEAAFARRRPASVRWNLARTDHPDAAVQEEASALLRLVVHDPDPEAVGRAVGAAAVELALASVPGLHLTAPPGPGSPYGTFESVPVDPATVRHVAVLPDGTRVPILPPPARPADAPPPARPADAPPPARSDDVPPPARTVDGPPPERLADAPPPVRTADGPAPEQTGNVPPPARTVGTPLPARPGEVLPPARLADAPPPERPAEVLPPARLADALPPALPADVPPPPPPADAPPPPPHPALPEPLPAGPVRRVPLGRVVGARSGDKGGSVNVGVWARDEDGWRWLAHTLTVDRFRQLLPETATLEITRYVLPNLRALNFVVDGLLGRGVAENVRFDPQGKGVGEWLRARYTEIPEVLL